jgi:1-acyl-sn-glycerol-3-phosphate acyltransferase/acyl carrier protein
MLKVRRHLLPAPVEGRSISVAAALAADDPVAQAIAGVSHAARVDGRQSLAELGLDSLGLVELATVLEDKLGRRIDDGDLRADMTVDQVRAAMLRTPIDGEAALLTDSAGGQTAEPSVWPYTWGRVFRALALPFDLLYRLIVTRTTVLGAEHLANLPAGRAIIFAGTHHSFPDMPLVRWGIGHSPARHLERRIIVVAGAEGFSSAGWYARFAVLAFGLFPLSRYGARGGSLGQLATLTSRGNALLIFPQGQHARPELERAGDPSVGFRSGVGHLAASLDAVVVPFGVAGTEHVMPASLETFKGTVVAGVPVAWRRGPLAIAFGEPMGLGHDEAPAAFVSRLESASLAQTRQAEAALPGMDENRRPWRGFV